MLSAKVGLSQLILRLPCSALLSEWTRNHADMTCSLGPIRRGECTATFFRYYCCHCSSCFTFLSFYISELFFEYGWSNLVIYCLRVGILTMGVLCIYADVLYTVIVLQVNRLICAWSFVLAVMVVVYAVAGNKPWRQSHFCCFTAMAYIWLWNWVQFCLFKYIK